MQQVWGKDKAIPKPSEKQLMVIVVDDQRLVVNALERVLKVAGYAVEGFTNPENALNFIQEETDIFALITDYRMPGMMGDQFLQLVQEKRPDLPCIVVTGVATKEIIWKLSEKAKITRILAKPWNTNALLDVLEQLKESAKPAPEKTKASRGR